MKKRTIFALILVGIVLFHIVNNLIIAYNDSAPFFSDASDYLAISFKIYSYVSNFELHKAFSQQMNGYTSLFGLLSVPFYFLFGLNQKSAIMTNFIFIVILVLSTYGLGRILHSKKAGLLAAFLIMIFPYIFSFSRTYYFDFALTSLVAMSFYFLLKTKMFSKRKYCIFLVLSVGAGLAIRSSFLVFFTLPFLAYLYYSFKNR